MLTRAKNEGFQSHLLSLRHGDHPSVARGMTAIHSTVQGMSYLHKETPKIDSAPGSGKEPINSKGHGDRIVTGRNRGDPLDRTHISALKRKAYR